MKWNERTNSVQIFIFQVMEMIHAFNILLEEKDNINS